MCGTESSINDSMSREVCCLSGVWIWDNIVEGLPKAIQPSDYYLLLLLHMGKNDAARGNLDIVKSDYRPLRPVIKAMGAQVVFSSVHLVRGKDMM